ncbi:MAG: methyltransferase [Pseudomonadota bacterium]
MNKITLSLAFLIAVFSTPVSYALDADFAAKLKAASEGEHRSDKNKARNKYRNPIETMEFFGLKPDMTIMEIAPGGGWYSEVLAPSMRDTGVFIAGSYDPDVEGQPKYRYRQHKALLEKIEKQADVYGQVQVATYSPPESRDLWESDSVDMVLTFRSSHGWTRTGLIDDIYSDFYKVLKPGGVLGVVQHRAPEGGDAVEWAKKGYVPESRIIEAAEKAGFTLDAKSEVNANPKDLKDHDSGVWRLPPTLTLGDEDREKYLEIGESDRMTLRFVKAAAE